MLGSQVAAESALFGALRAYQETCWINPSRVAAAEALPDVPLDAAALEAARARLARHAPALARLFGQDEGDGVIESPLVRLPRLQAAMGAGQGALWMKLDSHLPLAGSVKARGGFYEVLAHAEALALAHGLPVGGALALDAPECRALFARHKVAVGSTGNLGFAIGTLAARLGFAATVHMSADAREWKKARLRASGVNVVEHAGDYGAAVAAGRADAAADIGCHFVDDENSLALFTGYALAGAEVARQLMQAGEAIGTDRPLVVYLPCGVGGAPGGIAYGLKLAFGDAVRCYFAEPTHSPAMLFGLASGLFENASVYDLGLDNATRADGLAVARPSALVSRALARLVDGCYTVDDGVLYRLQAALAESEGLRLEPSALAGVPGLLRVDDALPADTLHLAWATGGAQVPEEVMAADLAEGVRQLSLGAPLWHA
ncbi:D-serine ammonia-lyase [Crenobacter caeni]|uniref:Probable D-serine dehydratase n=1 Tax=Crenobacter caeni TaxID=2705474 RepID=A0A6B2KUU4_9NEIS|nr:D-serine ammonia-lyase [Crenobacter caeni]NDV13727.1 D-serine ammonia-lyase [Crenobacter caeni]